MLLTVGLPLSALSATKPLYPNYSQIAPKTHPWGQDLYDQYPWSVMYYYGKTVNTSLINTLTGKWPYWPEHIQTIEVAHTLAQDNFLRKLVYPIVGVTEVAGNMTYRVGSNQSNIYEFDPYIIFRWANLPWNRYVVTSFGFAEGVSYVSSYPAVEKKQNDNNKRFLNYLMFEATFALPNDPQWQILARVHHRSGCFGLYGAGNTGSNDIGLGVRYLFD